MSKQLEPEIAVLFPVYNPGPELSTSLATLREQSVPFRLFLVDDGSTIEPDYAKLTKGMDCQVALLPKNVGIAEALNAGLSIILKGNFKYIARMDNGDLNAPTRFEKQIKFLETNPDVTLVGCAVEYHYLSTGLKIMASLPTDASSCARFLRYNTPLIHPTIMSRIEFFREVQGYPTDYPAAEDYALEQLAHSLGHKMCNLPEKLFTAVEHKQSISGGSRRAQLNSRFTLQRKYFSWSDPHAYFGLARTIALMILPINILRKIKKLMVPA